jgi:hypothetical protein
MTQSMPQYLRTYLLDERGQEFKDSLERIFFQIFISAKRGEHVDELVVNLIVLGRQLGEEHPRQIRNALVFILETLGHLSQLSFHLDLPSQDQEGQGHQTSSLHRDIRIAEAAVQEVCVLVDEVVEADSHVA